MRREIASDRSGKPGLGAVEVLELMLFSGVRPGVEHMVWMQVLLRNVYRLRCSFVATVALNLAP